MKTTNFLLAHTAKNIGWCIFIPSLLLGILHCCGGGFIEFSLNDILSLFGIAPRPETSVNNFSSFSADDDLWPTLLGILVLVGGFLVGFSKNKEEDEFTTLVRYESLLWAMYVNLIVLVLCFIFLWGIAFLMAMMYNLFTTLLLYITIFHIRLWVAERRASHDK